MSKIIKCVLRYAFSSNMKVAGNGVGGKILCANLTVSPKYGATLKSKFKVKKMLSAKYIP